LGRRVSGSSSSVDRSRSDSRSHTRERHGPVEGSGQDGDDRFHRPSIRGPVASGGSEATEQRCRRFAARPAHRSQPRAILSQEFRVAPRGPNQVVPSGKDGPRLTLRAVFEMRIAPPNETDWPEACEVRSAPS
jgi:hypothetical protein